jgi:flagellar motor component MotA
LIYALFFGFLIRGGVLAYKLSKKDSLTQEEFEKFDMKTNLAWFVSDKMLTLGMIGTVLGFIFMLGTSFAGLSTLTIPLLQAALLKMSAAASVALYTTASGLICGLLLQVPLFDFSQHLEKLARSSECKVE